VNTFICFGLECDQHFDATLAAANTDSDAVKLCFDWCPHMCCCVEDLHFQCALPHVGRVYINIRHVSDVQQAG